MNVKIREMIESDRNVVLQMMETFYSSDAVATNGSAEIFKSDVDACVSDNPFLEGYIFELEGKSIGYSMLAKSFSTEYGKPCIWIEDIYLLDEFRGGGIAGLFFSFIEEKYPGHLFRLEVEKENERAIRAYEKGGFDFLPYLEMKK